MQQNDNEYLAPSDVARRAGVSVSSVRLWEQTGRLPAIRTVGGMRLFAREDVDRFLAERDRRAAAAV